MKSLKRRRKEGKTNYHLRLKFLKSNSPRVVFRKTNNYVIAQYVTSREAQDKVEIGVNSKQLLSYGWPEEMKGSLKSMTASYFTGLLMGKKILENKKEIPIVDFGMLMKKHKSKVFAFQKGLVDSGLDIKYKDYAFPEEDRIKGKHLKKDFSEFFDKIKQNIENQSF